MLDRREILVGASAVVLLAATKPAQRDEMRARVAELEQASGGKFGVAIRDTGSGRSFAWRGDERFPMCSTFKFLLVSAVLQRVDGGQERLDRRLRVAKADMLGNSPVAEKHVGGTASIGELSEGAIVWSDNTAANLLLATLGGPATITAFARSLGDAASRLDHDEGHLNVGTSGDPSDTTTPAAMLANMQHVLLGNVLSPVSRQRLTSWMLGCRTGPGRLRAGLPSGWRIGQKTGTGLHGTANDIAIIWPPKRAPLLVASYLTGATGGDKAANRVHAQLARELPRCLA